MYISQSIFGQLQSYPGMWIAQGSYISQPVIHKADDPLVEVSAEHGHLLSAAILAHKAGEDGFQVPLTQEHPLYDFRVDGKTASRLKILGNLKGKS